MKTLTIELPEELFAKLNQLPREERTPYIADAFHGDLSSNLSDAIAETLYAAELEANFDPVKDAEECRLAIQEGLAEIEAGRSISLEEELARWEVKKRELLERAASK